MSTRYRGQGMMQGMARVYLAMFFLGLIFAVLALISCLSAQEGEVRGLPRLLWVAVILLFPLLGSVAYYFAGRPAPAESGGTKQRGLLGGLGGFSGPNGSTPRRILAPDDDPEFLDGLGRSIPPVPPAVERDDQPPPEKPTGAA